MKRSNMKFVGGVFWYDEDQPNGTPYKNGDKIYGIMKFRINKETVNVMLAEWYDDYSDTTTCYRMRISDADYRRYGRKAPHNLRKWQVKNWLKQGYITYM